MSMKFYMIEDMKKLAEGMNGQCTSKKYINAYTNLNWKCNVCGSTWSTTASHILNGSWCPKCAYKRNADKARFSIEMMQTLAAAKNGRCISDNYINSHTKLKWMCEKQHIWEAMPYVIKQGSWCPHCRREQNERKIEDFHIIAVKKGGQCLSNKYVNYNTKLLFKCAEGHEWEAFPGNIKKGTWCPVCIKKPRKYKASKSANTSKKKYFEDLLSIIKNKEGECLSSEYINSYTKIIVKCKHNHIFKMCPRNIKIGQWCPECSGRKKDTIENIKSIAVQKGGKCLSSVYINTETKLEWQCEKGHKWMQTPHMIKQGNWCPTCYEEQRGQSHIKYSIDIMRKFAMGRGGDCLSKEYIPKTKLIWKCSQGHIWQAEYHNLKRGDWCPECNNARYFNESKCRFIFEFIFKQKFNKNRTVLDVNLELDGYNKELNLAFEYNGKQHYEPIKRFHNSDEVFQKQCDRDRQKVQLCKEKGIRLLIIHYSESEKDEKLINYIIRSLDELKIIIKRNISETDFRGFYKNYTPLNELKEYAKSKGGKCLSNEYLGGGYKLTWECTKGHVWEAIAQHIKEGHWCPECAGIKKLTIDSMKKLAAEKGGKCLSEIYINSKTKLSWQCKEGHIWEAVPGAIKNQNQWCPICAIDNRIAKITKNTIKDIYRIANEHEGKCLSKEYNGLQEKLIFKCKKGHTWGTKPLYIIYYDSWCPICAKNNNGSSTKLSIDEMKELAKEKYGECLSDKYINSTTKLKWKCSKGHKWEAIPSTIKQGHWCHAKYMK